MHKSEKTMFAAILVLLAQCTYEEKNEIREFQFSSLYVLSITNQTK